MEEAVRNAYVEASRLLDEYAPVEISCERYEEREPHPGGQKAFIVRARMPWQNTPLTRIKIEISMDEKIIKPIQKCKVIHEYGEPLEAELNVYALEEIIAEKLRAILQHADKIEQRGWGRSRARDFYDLWRLFGTYTGHMDLTDFTVFLKKKCEVRDVTFSDPDDFFRNTMLAYVKKTWEQWLGPLVPNLPSFDTVITELRPRIHALFE
jgi:predicted nucleotidyltransferase component of viral defense system